MADEKKKFSLGGLDGAAEEKGSLVKTIWQLVKFMIVSGLVTIIQLVLANVLPFVFDGVKAELPGFLQGIFAPNTIFDASVFADITGTMNDWLETAKTFMNETFTKVDSAALKAAKETLGEGYKLMKTQVGTYVDINKYVSGYVIEDGKIVSGVVTWGYLLPFFLSNLIANIYGFYQNKKTTFKSDAPWYNFAIYIALMIALILFSTWLQGVIYGWLGNVKIELIASLARTIGGLVAGFVQMVVLFPMEKFVLLKEKKEDAPAEAE